MFVRGAPDSYLDRYGAERMPVARRLVGTTDTVFGIVTSDRRGPRLLRRWVLPAAAPIAAGVVPRLPGASRLFQYLSQTRIHYWMSDDARATRRGHRGRVVGRRLPWNGDNYDALRGLRWQVHVYGAVDAAVLRELRGQTPLPVAHFPVVRGHRLREGRCYLVRPDGFVAAAGPLAGAAAGIRRALPFTPRAPAA